MPQSIIYGTMKPLVTSVMLSLYLILVYFANEERKETARKAKEEKRVSPWETLKKAKKGKK